MSRAALLPTRADPFFLRLNFLYFENVWQNEVDRLYVLLNSPVEIEVIDSIQSFLSTNSKVDFEYIDHGIGHGNALANLMKRANEDVLLFIEDDSIIFKKGIVDTLCNLIEKNVVDCVGTPRYDLYNVQKHEAIEYFADDRILPGGDYWPCFFFARRCDLMKTDMHFAPKSMKTGEHIPSLQWATTKDDFFDTCGWVSWQLKAMKLRFLDVEQYRNTPQDVDGMTLIFDGVCPWIHTGSDTSAQENIFTDDKNVSLARRTTEGELPFCENIGCQGVNPLEIEKRIAWALLSWRVFRKDFNNISDYADLYKKSIDKYIIGCKLNMIRIEKFIEIYRKLISV